MRRGALVRLQPDASPSIVRVIAVPGDRIVVYRTGLFVLVPGSQAGARVDGLSAGLLGSAQYAAHVNEPMRKPRTLSSNEYFAVGDEGGRYFVDVIEASRIADEVPADHRPPRLPPSLHQSYK